MARETAVAGISPSGGNFAEFMFCKGGCSAWVGFLVYLFDSVCHFLAPFRYEKANISIFHDFIGPVPAVPPPGIPLSRCFVLKKKFKARKFPLTICFSVCFFLVRSLLEFRTFLGIFLEGWYLSEDKPYLTADSLRIGIW